MLQKMYITPTALVDNVSNLMYVSLTALNASANPTAIACSNHVPCMVERDEAKGMANKSVCTTDWQTYCKLRNHMTKINKKNKLH